MRRLDRRQAIAFIDVADEGASCPLDRAHLLERFHAQEARRPGRVRSRCLCCNVARDTSAAPAWPSCPKWLGPRLVGAAVHPLLARQTCIGAAFGPCLTAVDHPVLVTTWRSGRMPGEVIVTDPDHRQVASLSLTFAIGWCGAGYRSVAPVAFATAATTFWLAASISASVRVRSRGWNVTSTPSDFLPSASGRPHRRRTATRR